MLTNTLTLKGKKKKKYAHKWEETWNQFPRRKNEWNSYRSRQFTRAGCLRAQPLSSLTHSSHQPSFLLSTSQAQIPKKSLIQQYPLKFKPNAVQINLTVLQINSFIFSNISSNNVILEPQVPWDSLGHKTGTKCKISTQVVSQILFVFYIPRPFKIHISKFPSQNGKVLFLNLEAIGQEFICIHSCR